MIRADRWIAVLAVIDAGAYGIGATKGVILGECGLGWWASRRTLRELVAEGVLEKGPGYYPRRPYYRRRHSGIPDWPLKI
jgi:hypothetical protein